VVLATANKDKAEEITLILSSRGDVELIERPLSVGEVEETGITLEENAQIKAVALVSATGMPSLADDTGLEVDALDGAPGVYSARYAGEDASYQDNVDKLVREMQPFKSERERTARFTTVACLVFPDGAEISARGQVEGLIAPSPQGRGGFGYDPVFLPVGADGRSFSEMTPAEKNAISHRGRAFRALADQLEKQGHLSS